MLPLESDKWTVLEHAYGDASNIPDLLRALPNAKVKQKTETEPWFTLWSSLCHQCDVYSASFAALPHIIGAAATRVPQDRAEYLFMAGTIESMRHRDISPKISPEYEPAYRKSIEEAITLTLEALEVEPEKEWFQALLAALTAFRGYPGLSAAVADLERETECPKCGSEYIQRGYDWFEENESTT